MITKTTLQNARFPKLIADLMHSNQFMKMFSFYALTLSVITLMALLIVVNKEITVITLDTGGRIVKQTQLPKVEDEVSEAAKAYLNSRYKWQPSDVVKRLKESEAFILPNTLKAFQESVSKVARFSVDKLVSQTVYPSKIVVDLAKKSIFITGDRITSIQGMKAAGDLKLEISFEMGSRTQQNPWGIYITKEREE
jgi:hypothetical protein